MAAGACFKNRPQDLFAEQHILKLKFVPWSGRDSVFFFKALEQKGVVEGSGHVCLEAPIQD